MKKLLLFVLTFLFATGCITINKVDTKRDLVYPRHDINSEEIQQGIDCIVEGLDLLWNEENQVLLADMLDDMKTVASSLQVAAGIPVVKIPVTDSKEVEALSEKILGVAEDVKEEKETFVSKHDKKQEAAGEGKGGINWKFWFWVSIIVISVLAVFAPSVLVLVWRRLKAAGKSAADYLEELNEKAKEKLEVEEKAKKALMQITDGVEKIKEAHPELKEEIKTHLKGEQDREVEDVVARVKSRHKEVF